MRCGPCSQRARLSSLSLIQRQLWRCSVADGFGRGVAAVSACARSECWRTAACKHNSLCCSFELYSSLMASPAAAQTLDLEGEEFYRKVVPAGPIPADALHAAQFSRGCERGCQP